MNKSLEQLIREVELARQRYLAEVTGLSTLQGDFRVADDRWSIAQLTEHLVVAEQGGVNGMWKAAEGVRNGSPVWSGPSKNAGLSIETVVERTWQPKEVAPPMAVPRQEGPLGYWAVALQSCEVLLPSLLIAVDSLDPHTVIFPHPISGPLDVPQRLEFLRFHLDRHCMQVESIKQGSGFPNA